MKKTILFIGVLGATYFNAQLNAPDGNVGATTNPATGNVGIGTTSPSEKLEIFDSPVTPGVISLNSNRNDAQNVEVGVIKAKQYITEVAKISLNRGSGTNTGYLSFFTKETNTSALKEALRISENGNVGIGTTSPSSKLSVIGEIAKGTLTGIDGVYDNVLKYGYKPDLESGNGNVNRWHGIDASVTAGAAAGNKMKFRLYAGGVANQQPSDIMTLQGDGNVGIGTANPQAKLDVNGSVRINYAAGSHTAINIGSDANDAIISDNTSSKYYGGGYFFRVNDNASGYIDAMMLADNGNIGIGIYKPSVKLDVGGGINIANSYPIQLAGNDVNHGLRYNHYFSDNTTLLDGPFLYGSNGGSLGIKQGNAETQVLNWKYNGNVGIGTTDPQAKLDVSGNLLLRNYTNTVGAGASLLFSSYSSDSPGARIRSSLYFANESTSRSSLILSSYWEGYKDELTLMNGNVGIGITSPRYNLDVAGNSSFGGNMRVDANIQAKEVKVTLTPTADFVFAQDYALPKLEDVEKFVTENKHLPEVASAEEMKKEGVNIGEFQIKLLQKIEELTLYSIEQNKTLKEIQADNKKIKEENKELKKEIDKLKNR